jgi:hypothetical protein
VVKKIAESLPPEFLEEAIEEAIQKCVAEFSINSYEINGVLKELILARAKELIATKYTAFVDKKAEELAQKAFAEITKR